MERAKRICKKLLFLHPVLIVLLAAASGAGLGWVFLTGHEASWMAYPIYVLSFYALTVLCVWLVPVILRQFKKRRENEKAQTLEEKENSFRKSLISGMTVNLIYALFHMILGLVSSSVWTASRGIYQLVTALIHGILLWCQRRMVKAETEQAQQYIGWSGFQACGIWLLVLHLTMTGLVFQMVWNGEAGDYPGVLIFAVAAYTFYKLTVAIIRVVHYRKNATPLWGAARNIDLSEALMNLYTLQAAMLSIFSTPEQSGFRFLMNSLTGIAVCLMTVTGAIGMICHGRKRKNETLGET